MFRLKLFILCLFFLIALPSFVGATGSEPKVAINLTECLEDWTSVDCEKLGKRSATKDKGAFNIANIVMTPANLILSIGTALAVLFIIIGGLIYITSAGSEDKMAKGKKTVTAAVIGLLILVFSWSIIMLVKDKVFEWVN